MEKRPLPPGWEWKTFADVSEINPRRPSINRSDDAPTSFVPMAAVDEVEGRFARIDTKPFAEIKRGYTYFEENDVVFAKITPCMENGKAAVARDLLDGFGFGTTEFHVLRPKPGILPAWIHHFVRQVDFRREAREHFRGAVGQQRVPQDFLDGYSIPIPYPDDPARSLETQRRIVARIEALFAELREARRLHAEIVADTGRMMASVLRASFTGLSSNAPPVRLGDRAIAEILPGQHVMAADYSSAPPGTPYITGPADFGASFPVVSKWTEKPTVMSKPGDVLFTVKGSGVGKVNVAFPDEPVCIGRQIMAIRPNQNRLLTDFLFFALLGRFDEFQDLRQGAAIPGIRKEHVESIEIPLPSRNLQFQVISYVKAVQGEVVEMQQAQSDDTALLAEMEQSILAQAFRGEL